jgi:hypothetical protein
MDEAKPPGVRKPRAGRFWSAIVLAGLMVSGLSVPAVAEIVSVTPPGTFMRLSVGDDYGCALTPAGVAGCWGHNWGPATTPGTRPGPYREISVDWPTTCGLRADQAIECWGDEVAKSSKPLPGKFRSVSLGGDLVCGIRLNGDLACAQLEQYEEDHRPTRVAGPFSWVSAGWEVCAVDAARDVVCWNSEKSRPRRVKGPFTAVSVGFEHTCALRADKNIACWGENGQRQAPARVSGPFTAVAAGEDSTCAIGVDQGLACWGASDPPARVRGPFASVSVGGSTCALRTDGRMTCWGDPEIMPMPSEPLSLGTKVVQVQVGDAVEEYLETAESSPADYSTVSPMPVGLRLLPGPTVQGTPRKPGTYRIEIRATNLFGSITMPLTIDVARTTDFDANGDGLPDLVVGVPGEDVGPSTNAGAVDIFFGAPNGRYGSAGGLRMTQEDVAQRSERNDRFGAALSMADVTGDGVVDLIVGAPGEDAGAGHVMVLPGSATGLNVASPKVLAQGAHAAAGTAEPGDGFGSSLSVGDGLWVGAPGEDLAGAANAGVATRFPIKPLTSRGSVQYRQGARGVPGKPERGDRFGAALGHGGSVIGVPGEDIGRVVDAGMVVWKLKKSISQRSRGVPGRVERGDRFGAAVTAREVFGDNGTGDDPTHKRFLMAAIGAAGEDVKSRKDAGTALLIGETYDRKLVYSTIRPALGTAEAGDRYGSAVAFLSRPPLELKNNQDRLVVGAPGKDIGHLSNAGAARTVPLYRYCEHGCGSDVYTGDEEAVTMIEGKGHTPGVAGTGNQFGAAVSRLPGVEGAILVGAPGQAVAGKADAGAVAVLDPDPTHSRQIQQQASGQPQARDRFGTLPSR